MVSTTCEQTGKTKRVVQRISDVTEITPPPACSDFSYLLLQKLGLVSSLILFVVRRHFFLFFFGRPFACVSVVDSKSQTSGFDT